KIGWTSLTKSTGRSTVGSTGGGSFGLPSPARAAGGGAAASAHASSAANTISPESDIHSLFMALRESNGRTTAKSTDEEAAGQRFYCTTPASVPHNRPTARTRGPHLWYA